MATEKPRAKRVFSVIDAMDAPHKGRILRLRLKEGEPPTIRQLRGARLVARSPGGVEERLKSLGFAVFGGRPTDARLSRTGRVDLVVDGEDGAHPRVSVQWEVMGPV
jgi:hypothetical protein